jgi:hypothetical protein
VSVNYVSVSHEQINEADETPHPFLHPPSCHIYTVRVTGSLSNQKGVVGKTIANVQPRHLELQNESIARPKESEYHVFKLTKMKIFRMMYELNETYVKMLECFSLSLCLCVCVCLSLSNLSIHTHIHATDIEN